MKGDFGPYRLSIGIDVSSTRRQDIHPYNLFTLLKYENISLFEIWGGGRNFYPWV